MLAILGVGLARSSDRGREPYDVFRNRIMFPIRDARGRAIAFGGRAMDPNDNAKYLNSPETELFDALPEKIKLMWSDYKSEQIMNESRNSKMLFTKMFCECFEWSHLASVASDVIVKSLRWLRTGKTATASSFLKKLENPCSNRPLG